MPKAPERHFQAAKSDIYGRKATGKTAGLVEACYAKARLFEGSSKQAPEGSRFERYKEAVRERKKRAGEVPSVGMMKDMCKLAGDDAMKAARENRVWNYTRRWPSC